MDLLIPEEPKEGAIKQTFNYTDPFFDLDSQVPKLRIDETPETPKWALEPMYVHDVDGNIRLWQVGFDGESLIIRHGQTKTGNFVIAKHKVDINNSGRDLVSQAVLEARSRYHDKYMGDFYRPADHLPSEDIKPELANDYTPKKIKSWPVACMAKLDGMRMRVKVGDNGQMVKTSRENRDLGHITHLDEQFIEVFKFLPTGCFIEGELYNIKYSRNQLMSILTTRKKGVHPLLKTVNYFIFDIYLPNVPYQDRYEVLRKAFDEYYKNGWMKREEGYVAMISSNLVWSDSEIEEFRIYYVSQGYEGLILHKVGVGLETFYRQNRSSNMLKYKEFQDAEGLIVDVYEGKGTEEGLVMFKLKNDEDVVFGVRPRGGFDNREYWFKHPEEVLGRKYTYRYIGKTDYNVPNHAVGVGFRDLD